MTAQPQVPNTTDTPQGPPLPKWAYKIINPTLSALLRSPLHGLLSKQLMLLIFNGRKTGKRYTIPVGYLRAGNTLYLFSHSAWARNFIGGAPVAVRLQGAMRRGAATIIEDRAEITAAVQRMIGARGAPMAERMGLAQKDAAGVLQPHPAQGTWVMKIELQDAR